MDPLQRAVLLACLLPLGCSAPRGTGDTRAKRVALEREVLGLRSAVGRLERGESILPEDDIVVGIEEGFVRDLIRAQLPIEAPLDEFLLSLDEAEVEFRHTPRVRLRGRIAMANHPEVAGQLRVLGGIAELTIDPASGSLRATITADHVDIEKAAGLEALLSEATRDEASRAIRHRIQQQLPRLVIPVRIEEGLEFPAVTRGPVRLAATSMPLAVAVSAVYTGPGQMWVALRIQPGAFRRK